METILIRVRNGAGEAAHTVASQLSQDTGEEIKSTAFYITNDKNTCSSLAGAESMSGARCAHVFDGSYVRREKGGEIEEIERF